MAEWIEFGEGYALGALPSDVGAAYASWIAAKPDKATRDYREKRVVARVGIEPTTRGFSVRNGCVLAGLSLLVLPFCSCFLASDLLLLRRQTRIGARGSKRP